MGIETPGGGNDQVDRRQHYRSRLVRAKTFSTAADNQTEVTIHVLQE